MTILPAIRVESAISFKEGDESLIELEAQRQREFLKLARAEAIAAIKVTVSTGKVFDGDESSQTRMSRAIIGMQAANVSTIQWTLADNSVVDVILAELTEALILAGQKQAELWPIIQ